MSLGNGKVEECDAEDESGGRWGGGESGSMAISGDAESLMGGGSAVECEADGWGS